MATSVYISVYPILVCSLECNYVGERARGCGSFYFSSALNRVALDRIAMLLFVANTLTYMDLFSFTLILKFYHTYTHISKHPRTVFFCCCADIVYFWFVYFICFNIALCCNTNKNINSRVSLTISFSFQGEYLSPTYIWGSWNMFYTCTYEYLYYHYAYNVLYEWWEHIDSTLVTKYTEHFKKTLISSTNM